MSGFSTPNQLSDSGDEIQIRGAVLDAIGAPRPYAASRPITVSELSLRNPGPGEVQVRIEAAGICHSDLSVVDGNRPRPIPMLLGHEAAGIVTRLGTGVTDIVVGDRVVMTFLPRCGSCAACATQGFLPCTAGSLSNGNGTLLGGGRRLSRDGHEVNHHLGVSAFADHATVDRRSVVRVDPDVPSTIAALLGCAVLTGGGAVINAGRAQPHHTVAVVGLGGVGMAAVMTAAAIGVSAVYGIDLVQSKRDLACEVGADSAMTPADAIDNGVRADIVIEAVGNSRGFDTAIELVAPGGKIVSVGLGAPDSTYSIPALRLVSEGLTVMGSYLGSAVPERDIPRFAEMWRNGVLPLERLVSDIIPLDRINEAMDALADASALRQIIRFNE